MIATETSTWEDSPAMPQSNYRASGLVLRPIAVVGDATLIDAWHELTLATVGCRRRGKARISPSQLSALRRRTSR